MPKRKAQVEEEIDSDIDDDSEEYDEEDDEEMMAAGGGFDDEEEEDDDVSPVAPSFSSSVVLVLLGWPPKHPPARDPTCVAPNDPRRGAPFCRGRRGILLRLQRAASFLLLLA